MHPGRSANCIEPEATHAHAAFPPRWSVEERARQAVTKKTEIDDQAPGLCDQLAANPNDRAKPANVGGTDYNLLKGQSADAIANCQIAATNHPDQLWFQYQLARSLETTDDNANRQKALAIYKRLVDSRYPAAFDNLGWVYLSVTPPAYPTAIALFRTGTQLGDSDAMFSLAEMIKRGQTTPLSESETPLALITRAAQLGNQKAQDELANLRAAPDNQRAWNGCPPNYTIQGGVCKPYQGQNGNTPQVPDFKGLYDFLRHIR